LPENAAAVLCYILSFITGILFLALEPYNRNPFVRFHAWQSILLSLALIAVYISEFALFFVMPLLLAWMISVALAFGLFFLWLFLMWQAYNGKRFSLPIIGQIAERQAQQ